MDTKKIKIVEMVLATSVLACKWKIIYQHGFTDWYCPLDAPNILLDLLFQITYVGYVPLFVLIVMASISYKTPTGKYAKFFTGMALFLHIFCQIFLFQDITNVAEVISLMIFLALIIVLGLDMANQF